MAGFSNIKFLAPSHFAKPEANTAAITSAITKIDNTKPVLLPPSMYAKAEIQNKPKNDAEKLGAKVSKEKSTSSLKENVQNKNQVDVLSSELQRVKRRIRDLEEERATLLENVEDRQGLSQVVYQLKKDLKKSKEKLNIKEKSISARTEEYADMIKCLRSDLQEAEHRYSSLKQKYSNLLENLKISDDTSSYLKRKIEAKDLEMEHIVQTKEKEIQEMAVKLKELLLERDVKNDTLTHLEKKYKLLEESKRQIDEEHQRCLRDVMKMKEEYNSLKIDKDRIEEDLSRTQKDLHEQNFLGDMERMKGDMRRIEQDKMRLEEEKCRIEQDKSRIEEEKSRIAKDKSEVEENFRKIEKRVLDEQERSQSEMEAKNSVINELKVSVEMKQDELEKLDLHCKSVVEDLEKEFRLKVSDLEDEIRSKHELLRKETQVYEETLLKKDEEIEVLSKSAQQLRSYIGDIKPSQDVEKLRKTNEQITNTMQVLTDENNSLHSAMKLLNVRLSAILEIVSIQEAEMGRHGDVIGSNGGSEGLLKTWREKVFTLMVQLRSQKIVERETKRKEDVKLDTLQARLQELEGANSILNHKLADQEAATELEVNKRTQLQRENEKLREESSLLKIRQEKFSEQFQTLNESTKMVEKTLLQSLAALNKTVSKLTSFDQRIKFAGSRIQFISEFLGHRHSQQKVKPNDLDDGGTEVISDESHEEHLKSEVERLLQERAVLLNETKKHNQTLQEKTTALQEQYENIIVEKNTHIEQLEVSNSENKERLHSLQDELGIKRQELEEASETIEELKLSLSKEKAAIEQEHRHAMEKDRLKNAEDMSIMESQLNDIRREHAKAVAALKHAEGRVNREKKQADDMVMNIEREYNQKLARCEKQLKNVEKERNLLMVRIREDRSTVIRCQPASGRARKETSSNEKQSPGIKNVQDRLITKEEQENINPIDATEALTALKEIKVLSQQIVKLHDKSKEASASDSEL